MPFPRQRGHGCESANRPWLSALTPRPWHSGHRIGAVPGLAPEPPHSRQAVSSSTGIVVCDALQGVLEREPHLDLDVAATLAALLLLLAPAGAEEPAEDVAEIAEVAEVEALGEV